MEESMTLFPEKEQGRWGSVVKAKVGELEKIKREGRNRRMRKEVMGCVQCVVGKTKFLVLF